VSTEVAESKGGGREGLKVVGSTELQKAVDARLVCASGGWGNAKQLEVV
jgi:hypothetical protein